MDPDLQWLECGGDPAKLALYREITQIKPFADWDGRCLAAVHPADPEVGTIGDWVGADSARVAAEEWLRSQGCRRLRGPMEVCSWFPHRVNLGPYEASPFITEPTERPERWFAAGYEVAAEYTSVRVEAHRVIAVARNRVASLAASGWSVRAIPTAADGKVSEQTWRSAVSILYRLASEAFEDAVGYARVPEETVQRNYAAFRRQLDPRLIFTAYNPEGEAVGFNFCLPDRTQPERRWFIDRMLAVQSDVQPLGVGSWLIAAAHQAARKAGYEAGIHAMIPASTRSVFTGPQQDGRLIRRYATLERAV